MPFLLLKSLEQFSELKFLGVKWPLFFLNLVAVILQPNELLEVSFWRKEMKDQSANVMEKLKRKKDKQSYFVS